MRQALTGLAVALLLLPLAPTTLLAHGRLKGSTPAAGAHLTQAPRQLRLDFSETAEMAFTSVRLMSTGGRNIALGALAYAPDSRRSVIVPVMGPLESGTYVVVWQVAGDDGHPVRGRFQFVFAPGAMGTDAAPGETQGMHHDPVSMPEGDGFGAASPLYVAVRWLEFAAVLVIVGAVAFRYLVLGHIEQRTPEQVGAARSFLGHAEWNAAGVGSIAAGLLLLTLLLRLAAQSYAMHGSENPFGPALVSGMLRRTMWGWGWLLQLTGTVLAAVGFHRARVRSHDVLSTSGAPSLPAARWWLLAACGAIAVALSAAMASHAASAPRLRELAIVADATHVLAASSWLGTLTVMLVAGIPAAMGQSAEGRGACVRSLVNAFSPVALASAGVAAATGTFAAWLHVGTVPNLWSTRYGITLLIKLAILGVVALTGFYNWRYVQPQLGTDQATGRLQRSARVEVAVTVLVLLVTAVLVATPTSMDATM